MITLLAVYAYQATYSAAKTALTSAGFFQVISAC